MQSIERVQREDFPGKSILFHLFHAAPPRDKTMASGSILGGMLKIGSRQDFTCHSERGEESAVMRNRQAAQGGFLVAGATRNEAGVLRQPVGGRQARSRRHNWARGAMLHSAPQSL